MKIVQMLFGSQLYGTATEESDLDYKGVALPTWGEVALGKIPKHMEYRSTKEGNEKNTSQDVDIEIFSLHEFIKLGLDGQTVAFDMLHAPKEFCQILLPLWEEIVANKEKFYSKNIESFIGYAQKQAARYGIKGSRINAIAAVIEFLKQQEPEQRIKDIITRFPTAEHITIDAGQDTRGISLVEICGRKFHYTTPCKHLLEVMEKLYKNYGERARTAANDEGIDWKAISHAFRAAYQTKELFTEGTITFPRPEREFLLRVKQGELKYKQIEVELEQLIEEARVLRNKSNLPEEPDKQYWTNFLISAVQEYIAKPAIKQQDR